MRSSSPCRAGWRRIRRRQEQFVAHVAQAFARDPDANPTQITRSVFKILTKHMAMGAAGSLKKSLPEEIRELFD
jgi:uncharacterized protein (DUF2267 family)